MSTKWTILLTHVPPVFLFFYSSLTLDTFSQCHDFYFCSLHPTQPVLATSSGQRHVPTLDDDEDLPSDTDSYQENSLKLWLCK